MLFNSYEFIFLYMPVVFFGFFWIGKLNQRLAALWLGAASVFFYGYWNPKFVGLLLASVIFNYGMGYVIGHARGARHAKALLILAITADLALLGVFKYTNFFISSVNAVADAGIPLADIILPLGISFFTFTQIAFLVDVYRGIASEYKFIHYLLFVTYFPHLIAGPVLHHKQMMPQFAAPETYRMSAENVAIGLAVFTIGLAKKVLFADSFAEYATPVFDAARDGAEPHFFVAWTGALAYTLQLYFDFSGYSDMAIGLSKMFGVDLPLNFNSPYKAQNIVEFWRRWHMTLSRFLRDYLYYSLGGNRFGPMRRHFNLMLTMLLGGLWHGANWTFVVWGGLHGLYLVINHGWRALARRIGTADREPTVIGRVLGTGLTFLAVVAAWVFFRAESFAAATSILAGMADVTGGLALASTGLPEFESSFSGYSVPVDTWPRVVCLFGVGLGIIFLAPNTQSFADRIARRSDSDFVSIGATSFGCFVLAAINASRGAPEFIYFNF